MHLSKSLISILSKPDSHMYRTNQTLSALEAIGERSPAVRASSKKRFILILLKQLVKIRKTPEREPLNRRK